MKEQAKQAAYPEPQRTRSGCKVAWNIYTKKRDATRCSKVAKDKAAAAAASGYDFGFCVPGSITVLPSGDFEVCIP